MLRKTLTNRRNTSSVSTSHGTAKESLAARNNHPKPDIDRQTPRLRTLLQKLPKYARGSKRWEETRRNKDKMKRRSVHHFIFCFISLLLRPSTPSPSQSCTNVDLSSNSYPLRVRRRLRDCVLAAVLLPRRFPTRGMSSTLSAESSFSSRSRRRTLRR